MLQQAQAVESVYLENEFGAVTDRRVIFRHKKSWFSSGAREDIPIQHVTSVRVGTQRSLFWSAMWFFVFLTFVTVERPPIFSGISLLFSLLLFWGSPVVVVNTSGRDLIAAKGWPWRRRSASRFVEALRAQMFR